MTPSETLRENIKDILYTVCECCSSENQLNKILALIEVEKRKDREWGMHFALRQMGHLTRSMNTDDLHREYSEMFPPKP